MALISVRPPLSLMASVDSLWDCRMSRRPGGLERVLPMVGACMIVNLQENETRVYGDERGGAAAVERYPGAVLCGPRTRAAIIDTAEQMAVAGVTFRPGGAYGFFAERLDLLLNIHVGIEDLLGSAAAGLRQRLLEAGDAYSRLSVLSDWLVARAPTRSAHPLTEYAVRALDGDADIRRIGSIADDSGWSQRHLREVFRRRIGVSPKRYVRLQRFRKVVSDIHRRRRVDWSRAAMDGGFCDQAHLVHEFRAFSGMTPTQYVDRRGVYVSHVAVD